MPSVLGLVIKWLVALGFAGALVWQLLRWRLDLYVLCARKSPDNVEYSYTCVLHNAESEDLTAPFAFEIALEREGAQFNGPPHVYVSPVVPPSSVRIVQRSDTRQRGQAADPRSGPVREVLVIEGERLRAKETWFVRFGTLATPTNVSVRIVSREVVGDHALAFPLVQYQELRPARTGGVIGASGTSRHWTWLLMGSLSAYLYLTPMLGRATWWRSRTEGNPQALIDLAIASSFFLLSWVLMRISWLEQRPFIQGYLDSRVLDGSQVGGTEATITKL